MFRLMTTLAILLIIILYCTDSVISQSASPYVYRIKAGQCTHEPINRRQTGFRLKGKQGILTALHGIADCQVVSAVPDDISEPFFNNLSIAEVDIERDVALLTSDEITSDDGFNAIQTLENFEDLNFRIIGYPLGLARQTRTERASIVDKAILSDLIPVQYKNELRNRSSPSLEISVLQIQTHLVPGHSGAPVLNSEGEVVGIGDGGLERGTVEIGWLIPIYDIVWQPASRLAVKNKLAKLRDSNPQLALSFSSTFPNQVNSSFLFTYNGFVVDNRTNEPIENVEVLLTYENIYDVEYTDSEGFYTFSLRSNPETARTSGRLLIEAAGYKQTQRNVFNLYEQEEPSEFQLEPLEDELYILEEGLVRGTYIIQGSAINKFAIGDNLVAYDKLPSGAEIPVGILQVTTINPDTLFAQPLFIHPERPIRNGMRLNAYTDNLPPEPLIPAIEQGIGIFSAEGIVRLKVIDNIGASLTLEALKPVVINNRIVTYVPYDPPIRMQVTTVGMNRNIAIVELIGGTDWPPIGTIVSALAPFQEVTPIISPTPTIQATVTPDLGATQTAEINHLETLIATMSATKPSTPPANTPTPVSLPTLTPTVPLSPPTIVQPPPMAWMPISSGPFIFGLSDSAMQKTLSECGAIRTDCEVGWFDQEQPERTISLNVFEISKYEISNEQYELCVKAGVCQTRNINIVSDIPYNATYFDPSYPAIAVTNGQAATFCRWMGGRLPTEEEWEKAARGTDGRRYPWGDDYDGSRVNLSPTDPTDISKVFPQPVQSHELDASPYGVVNMSGNIFEWTASLRNGKYVLRGGSWFTSYYRGRVTDRGTSLDANFANYDIGFRCVR